MADSADLTFQEIVNQAIKAEMPDVRRGAEPPADGKFPYIQFGQSYEADEFAHGSVIVAEVHTWSTAEGPHEVKQLQHRIKGLLQRCHHTRGVWQFTAVRQQDARVFLDEDEETWHGVQKFRALASVI